MFKHFSNLSIDDPNIAENEPPTQSTNHIAESLPNENFIHPLNDGISDDVLLQLADEYCNASVTTSHSLPDTFDLTTINRTLAEIWNQIDIMLTDRNKPPIIEIHNFHNLKINAAVCTVKEKVNALFFDALIPITWKTTITWTDKPNSNEVDIVTITMINFRVKQRVIEILTKYFDKMYHNTVYI